MEIDWNFIKEDWIFERSSGYAGWRNLNTDKWIYDADYNTKSSDLKEFEAFKQCATFFSFDYELEYDAFMKNLFIDFKTNGFYICKNEINN